MLWYASSIRFHRDGEDLVGEENLASSLVTMASTRGLVSTDVDGPELLPTIALERNNRKKTIVYFKYCNIR